MLGVALAIPLWIPTHLPLVDVPQHLAIIADLARYDGSPALQADYWVNRTAGTNVLLHILTVPMVDWLGAERALRVVLSVGMCLLPVSLGVLASRVGGRPGAGALGLPLAYSAPFAWGFLNFWLAWPFLVLGVAWSLPHPEPRIGRHLGLALVAIACFLAHVQAWLLLALAAPLVAAASSGRRAGLLTCASLAPSCILFGFWLARSLGPGSPYAAESGGFGVRYDGFLDRIGTIGADSVQTLGWNPVQVVGNTAWVALMLWAASRVWRTPSRNRMAAWLAPSGALVAWVLLPDELTEQYFVATRMLLPFLLLTAAVLAPSGRDGRVCAVIAAAVVTLGSITNGLAWRAFDREAAGLDRILALAEPGKRMLGVLLNARSEDVSLFPYKHFASYYTVQRGGESAFSFARFTSSPLRFRHPEDPVHLRPGQETAPWCALLRGDLAPYDYYLVRSGADPCQVRQNLASTTRLGGEADAWTLYAAEAPVPAWHPPGACKCSRQGA